jgi:hypothetical protein
MLPSYRRKKSASLLGVTAVYISYMEGGKKRPGKTMKKLLDCIARERKREGGCNCYCTNPKLIVLNAHLGQEHKKNAVNLLNGLTAASNDDVTKRMKPTKKGLQFIANPLIFLVELTRIELVTS